MEASKSPSIAAGTVGHPDGPASLAQVHDLFKGALASEPQLKMLRGFKLDFSGNSGFHKVYFSARCDCGTAALLSVEVDRSKSLLQVEEALPELTEHLKGKVGQFQAMSCEMHSMMRTGKREAKLGTGADG
jgi:hypothetical protein